ncbi:response regulator [Sorangium sp. So ce394]|uniref:Response regulator n=1 Tax=Sorangium cellulosum TaxID=56 RepID=A0A150S4B6_SORCE|nr:response regulator [Sorangium cellulosum]KYF99379.1 response regulator [Sorangium cellulosum]
MAHGGRILVIDDSEIVLMRIRVELSSAGYDVVTTTQLVGTARHLRGCDLVIIDFFMPGLDGGAVLRSLKAAVPATERPPLFYLYTTDAKAGAQYAELGFDGVFGRKGDLLALTPQVEAALRIRKLSGLARAKERRA